MFGLGDFVVQSSAIQRRSCNVVTETEVNRVDYAWIMVRPMRVCSFSPKINDRLFSEPTLNVSRVKFRTGKLVHVSYSPSHSRSRDLVL